MKTYLIDGVYYGTQADAKAACKASGIKFDADFHEEDVPTGKDGLLAYLNRLSGQNAKHTTPPVDDLMDEPLAGDPVTYAERPTSAGLQKLANGADADVIVEYLGNADHPTLARVTEASIFRMRELLKEAEGPSTDDLMG